MPNCRFFSFIPFRLCRRVKTIKARYRFFLGITFLIISGLTCFFYWKDFYYLGYRSVHWVTYGTRPIWDRSNLDFKRIPFRANPDLNFSSPEICHLFGWQKRTSPIRIYDAVIFSIELGNQYVFTFYHFKFYFTKNIYVIFEPITYTLS